MFWIKVIVGAIIASMRWVRRHSFVFGVVVGVACSGALSAHATSGHVVAHDNGGTLSSRVTTLTHACTPMNTGGGVTQCANPTTFDVAIMACARAQSRGTYIGGTVEDTSHLFVQCVDDFMRMKGWR